MNIVKSIAVWTLFLLIVGVLIVKFSQPSEISYYVDKQPILLDTK